MDPQLTTLSRSDARGYSNHMRVARITYSPTNAAPSNKSASPSPVICHMARAVMTSAPMKIGLSTNVRCVVNASEPRGDRERAAQRRS